MARFRFRLASLLRLREMDRQQRRVELAQADQAENLLRQQSANLLAEQVEMRKRSQVASGPGLVQVDRLLDAHRYTLVLQAGIQVLTQKREQLSREIERRRRVLMEADRDVRILEKLRDKLRTQHREDEMKREWKQLDEVAQRCAGRVHE